MKVLESAIERLLPDYRVRHIFAMKLRLIAFAGFWLIFLFFLRDVLAQTKAIAAVICACFLCTGIAYANILRNRWLVASFSLELFCDLVAITVVLYLTGGAASPYYTIYLFYTFVAGILYTSLLAGVVAVAATVCYAVFLLLDRTGAIPPLAFDYGGHLPAQSSTPLVLFFFTAAFLAGIVYTVKAASFFSQRRERILEKRNRELTALNRMSSTIRSAVALHDVIEQLLAGILEGLEFETAVLVRFDWVDEKAILSTPRRTARLTEIERMLGRPVDGMTFPLEALPPLVMQDIRRHRVIFRRTLSELAEGLQGAITPEQCDRIQQMLGARRIVIMPIVVERGALGALLGFSREPFVEEEQVATLEAFANQSALSLEAATLIDRLRRLNDALAEANRVKSEFLATMSHELRTPLTAIIGFSELLMEGVMGEPTAEQREGLTEVLHNAADLLELINSLLDLTKIESGKMKLEVRSFDVAETFRRVTATIAPLVQKKGQHLAISLPPSIPSIAGDERKVQQLILNLLANANKFTPEGGHITASLQHFGSWEEIEKSAPWAEKIRGAANEFQAGGIEIVVADDGMGVAPEHLERIFEMFHQADSGAARNFGGTGVGLALARKFVQMHGGRIWVESELGKGARFIVVIPVSARKLQRKGTDRSDRRK